jgi:hypothetical protein
MRNHFPMNCIRRLCLSVLILAAVAVPSLTRADIDKAGTTAASFLSLGSGPRILGMGGATLGLGEDLAAGSWNPAALGWMHRGSFAVSHAGIDEESLQEWMGMGGRIGKTGTRWSVSGLYQDDGTFEGRDASNNPTGDFKASSFAIGVHAAHQIGPMFTVGLGFKSVSERLADVSGSGITFDGGVMFRHGMFGAGLAAQNVGGRMKYQDSSYPFPTNYGIGVGMTHSETGLSVALDANFPNAYHSDVRAGLEWRWRQMLALRTGYRHEMGGSDDPLSGPSFGIGAGMNGFWLDYGYLLSGAQNGGQHRMALTFYPGMWSGFGSDPFGQGDIPREFDSGLIGPPTPRKLKTEDE